MHPILGSGYNRRTGAVDRRFRFGRKVSDMKIRLQRVALGEEEIIIRYHEMTREVSDAVRMLSGSGLRLEGTLEEPGRVYYFAPEDVFYFESVDGVVYACLEKEVYRVREKLEEITARYGELGIVRCARTMAVNLYKIEWLKSQPGGRILACLLNGENVVISRKYREELRARLRQGGS